MRFASTFSESACNLARFQQNFTATDRPKRITCTGYSDDLPADRGSRAQIAASAGIAPGTVVPSSANVAIIQHAADATCSFYAGGAKSVWPPAVRPAASRLGNWPGRVKTAGGA
jgi:hypothetical protein